MRRFVVVLPSLALGLLAALAWWWRPPPLEPSVPLAARLAAGVATGVGLLLAAAALERLVPSFRFASRLLERAIRPLRLSRTEGLALALLTSVAEEVAFRGVLLAWIGLLPQAALFGLLHPATRRGWSYSVFTAVVGVALGALTLWSGGLLAAITAHAVVNGHGFWTLARRR